ncbi:MAG: hypothetical protein LBK61_02435 [Spirochaetaceae bacterium]|nr:hypothetical protein [Spirochaetaceae bacterium]
MPLRGAKTLPGFHPIGNHFRCENCLDLNHTPILAEESAAGRQNTPLWRTALRGAKTLPGFHPIVNPVPM